MLSDTVLIALISTTGTVITTVVAALSGRKTREHVKKVQNDVSEIKNALYLDNSDSMSAPTKNDRAAQFPTIHKDR